MPRYKLTIEYDGAPFVGWQRQANGRSVQQAIEEALVRLTGEEPTCAAPGARTPACTRSDRWRISISSASGPATSSATA